MKCVLAIDPGTKCGWALSANGSVASHLSGTWDLSPRRHEGGGMRFVRLRSMLQTFTPELVAYEEVRRHLGTDAAHIYGGIVATVQAWCEERRIPYTAIPVGTIKKHATGKGNADKAAMLCAARSRWGEIGDDNQADALFLLSWVLTEVAPQ